VFNWIRTTRSFVKQNAEDVLCLMLICYMIFWIFVLLFIDNVQNYMSGGLVIGVFFLSVFPALAAASAAQGLNIRRKIRERTA